MATQHRSPPRNLLMIRHRGGHICWFRLKPGRAALNLLTLPRSRDEAVRKNMLLTQWYR